MKSTVETDCGVKYVWVWYLEGEEREMSRWLEREGKGLEGELG